jgi:uncharacterized protein
MLEVGPSSRGGRGVFASQHIDDEVLLMTAPLLLIPGAQRDHLARTIVDDYVYEWDDDGTAALVLGISSMINHATEPNAFLWLIPDDTSAELWSIREIAEGEEVTVSYRAEGPAAPLWFEVEDPV